MAPLNPDFLKYTESIQTSGQTASPSSRLTDDGYALGYIQGPVDRSHLKGSKSALQGVAYPVSYDLRTTGKLTPVKNQGACGSCWAFATYGSLESNLLTGAAWDFSENNLNTAHGFDWYPCDGGNADISIAYLTRWSGPLSEAQEPYNAYDTTPKPVEAPNLSRQGNIQQALYIPLRSSSTDNDNIKNAVMNYGAIYTAYYHNNSYYKSSTASYYYSGSSYSNHAVAIVGWDDNYAASNFITAPPGNGAFIVKNSWGTSWGQAGYFYVSYYDSRFARAENAIFKNLDRQGSYQSIYQYDPFGWISSYGYSSNTGWFANIFTAAATEDLGAVGFYAARPDSSYEVHIYKNLTSGPTSGTLAVFESGWLNDAGYHTIALTDKVPLYSGETFSIVVKLTTPGYNYPIPVEYSLSGYSSKATASPGQSYISANGTSWSDITTAYKSTANVCLKGYAVNASATTSILLTSGWNLISVPLQPSNTAIGTVLNTISGNYTVVWAYTNGVWKLYDPSDVPGSTLTAMEAGTGYWIKMGSARTLDVSGTTAPISINLGSGWNLTGYNKTVNADASDVLISIINEYTIVWSYINGVWKLYDPLDIPGSTLTEFLPGYGYWIKTTQEVTWTQ